MTFPLVHAQLDPVAVTVSRAAVPARDGLLLLLGAVALAVLALASGSMARLLGRMEGAR